MAGGWQMKKFFFLGTVHLSEAQDILVFFTRDKRFRGKNARLKLRSLWEHIGDGTSVKITVEEVRK